MSSCSDEEHGDHVGSTTTTTTKPELTDDPKMSSAALCIELCLLASDNDDATPTSVPPRSMTFRPEFTHQCFPGEQIRGYQPHQDLIPSHLVHKSYEHHDEANQELSIAVNLAPSARYCTVQVKIRKKRFLRGGRHHHRICSPTKRVKVDDKCHNKEEEEADSSPDKESEASSFQASETTAEEEEESDFSSGDIEDEEEEEDDDAVLDQDGLDPEGETRHRRMSPAEIVQSLRKALPNLKRRGNIKDDYLPKPVGVVLQSYQRKGAEYCISLATGREAAKYHSSVQRLALLFIENADDVVADSDDGGYWKVLYLFRKHGPKKFSLAGYVTLFHFSAPFRKPKPGTIVRVCQAVVLPPYQREGHGREMLHSVHDLAQGNFDDKIGKYGKAIVEINVEDPAPGFVALRNLVDYERYVKAASEEGGWFKELCHDVDKDDFFDLLPESVAREMSLKSKLTVTQMQVIFEIDRLCRLHKAGSKLLEKHEKRYRLMVKKRLNRDNKEELSMCRNKEGMKQMLEEMYQEQRTMYDRIFSRCQ